MSDGNWYCVLNGKQAGPFSLVTFASMIRARQVQANDLVWREGMQQWQAAISVEELRALFSAAPVPGAPVPPLQYYGQQPPQVTYAGFWLRFLAVIIDGMIIQAGPVSLLSVSAACSERAVACAWDHLAQGLVLLSTYYSSS